MDKTIYCISGLGADEKVFTNLNVEGYRLRYLPWLRPFKKETLPGYAARMAEAIQHDSPLLLGVSFGGMVGIEIARQRSLQKLFIVSSIKTGDEMPYWMKVAATFKLHKWLPTKSYKITEKFDNSRIGVSTPVEMEMVRNYRKSADPVYMKWAIDTVLNWRNDWHPEHIVHIHGERDKIFPLKKVKPHHVVKGGTHLMIFNRAQDISRIIHAELS